MILRSAIEVQAPAAAIFAFFDRVDEHYLAWHPDHIVFRWTHGRGLEVGHRAYFEEMIAGKRMKKEVEYTHIEPGRLVEFAPVHQPMRWFLPRMLFRLEDVDPGTWRVVQEIHLRVGPLGEWLNQREFDAVREHMRVEGLNLKRIVEGFVASGRWPTDAAQSDAREGEAAHAIDAPVPGTAPETAADTARDPAAAGHDARVQRRVDARCLEHQLMWIRRSIVATPIDVVWVLLASFTGMPVGWWLPWLAARFAMHGAAPWFVRRWTPAVQADPARGLAATRPWFVVNGLLHAVLMPFFYIGTDDVTKLLAMALSGSYFGSVVVSASGQQRSFWAMVLPSYAVYLAGWLERGGWMGWLMTLMLLHSAPLIVVSIRQQRRSWEELVRLADDRERLAVSLAAERDRAEAASSARTRFFAAASHDLRQPLHALSVNATTLELLARRAGNAQLTDLSSGIGRALVQSQGLLDALLDISRLDAGAVHVRAVDVDVAEVLRELHAQFAGVAAQRGLAFTLDLPPAPVWARTDPAQLQRILRNLLDNAFKFTDAGRVGLALTHLPLAPAAGRAPHAAGHLRITVADTGCGIAAADRDKVFEEFFQVGNPTRDRGHGLGLGLAIVRRTAKLLGAQVRLAAAEGGRGATFEIVLPALDHEIAIDPDRADAIDLAPRDQVPRATTRATVRATTGTTTWATTRAEVRCDTTRTDAADHGAAALSVLVVDDEPDIVHALCGLMRATGWQAHPARDADEALALVGTAAGIRIDVAVIDHRLPGSSGVELALRLRERRPDLPALIVTGDVTVQWQVQRHGLRVLHKPLGGAALTEAIAAEVAAASRWATRFEHFETPDGGPIMNIIDAVHGRRSVRRFLDKPVPRDVVEDLIWHAAQVPRPPISDASSWAFHVIEGRERLADFGVRAKRHAVDQPPSGTPQAWSLRGDFDVFWDAPLAVLMCARRGHPEAPFDCCRAGQNLALLAHARGLGSCWIGAAQAWLDSPEGREATALPAGFDAAAVLALGYAASTPPGQSAPRPVISWCG